MGCHAITDVSRRLLCTVWPEAVWLSLPEWSTTHCQEEAITHVSERYGAGCPGVEVAGRGHTGADAQVDADMGGWQVRKEDKEKHDSND